MSCPSCNTSLSEKALYCPKCGLQAKCKDCRELLEFNAKFCTNCGSSVKIEPLEDSKGANKNIAPVGYNIIEFDQDDKSKRLRVQVSDKAMESVGHSLTSIVSTQFSETIKQRFANDPPYITNGQLVLPNTILSTTEIEDLNKSSNESVKHENEVPPSTNLEVLRRIFRVTSDNKLKLSDSRLKPSSRADFVKRLTVLFLYTHELEGREAVLRADLKLALSEAKVYDGNARHWIANTELLDRDDILVRLTLPGRDYAQKFLHEYADPGSAAKWSFETKVKARPNKKQIVTTVEGDDANEKSPRRRASKELSYTAQVKNLLKGSFFSEGRASKDVQAELEKQGYNFELKRISEVLLKLLKQKVLIREQSSSKDWIYKKS